MIMKEIKDVKPFELWVARDCLGAHVRRPVIVVSTENDLETVTIVPLTSDRNATQLATHVLISGQGLDRISRALCEQVMTVSRNALIFRIGCVYEPYDRFALRHALAVHLGLQAEEGDSAWI